jgi:hypothetical protein
MAELTVAPSHVPIGEDIVMTIGQHILIASLALQLVKSEILVV